MSGWFEFDGFWTRPLGATPLPWSAEEAFWEENHLDGATVSDWPGDELLDSWSRVFDADRFGLAPRRIEHWTVGPERLEELRAMPYQQYLETPEWRYRRRQLIKDREYKCDRCRRHDRTLNIHHRTYCRLGNEHPDDLQVLCDDCHRRTHKG